MESWASGLCQDGANVPEPYRFPAGSNPALSSKNFGGVTEWFMVPDLNSGDSVIIPDRGFESYRLFYKLNNRVHDVVVALLIACENAPVRIRMDAYFSIFKIQR